MVSARDQDGVLPWVQVGEEEAAFRVGGCLSFTGGDLGSHQRLTAAIASRT